MKVTIGLQEAIDRYTRLERWIYLKQADPELNREEVYEMAAAWGCKDHSESGSLRVWSGSTAS